MRQEIESPSKSQALSELPPLNVCKLVCRHFTPPFFKYLFLLTPYRSVDISALDNQVSDFGIFRRLRSLKITFVKPTAGGNAYWKHYPRGFPWS